MNVRGAVSASYPPYAESASFQPGSYFKAILISLVPATERIFCDLILHP